LASPGVTPVCHWCKPPQQKKNQNRTINLLKEKEKQSEKRKNNNLQQLASWVANPVAPGRRKKEKQQFTCAMAIGCNPTMPWSNPWQKKNNQPVQKTKENN